MDTVKRRKEAHGEIETASGDTDAKEFYTRFIVRRVPVKLTPTDPAVPVGLFQPATIVEHLAYHEPLQVERRDAHGFGGGQQREKLGLASLMEKLVAGDDSYYLTTQYGDEDEDDNNEDSEEVIDGNEDEDEDGDDEEAEIEGFSGWSEDGDESQDDSQADSGHSETAPENAFSSPVAHESDSDAPTPNPSGPLVDDYIEVSPDEARVRVRELFQPPLSPGKLPLTPSLFPTLVPQQINLWMGRCNPQKRALSLDKTKEDWGLGRYVPNGQSSGLHHDHADNLYVLLSGRKRFTIFPPSCGRRLATVGTIRKVYDSGVIDYEHDDNAPSWRHIRDDGALETEVLRWKLENSEPADEAEIAAEEERLERVDKEKRDTQGQGQQSHPAPKPLPTPPSFSKIPPALLHLDEFDDPIKQELQGFRDTTYPEVSAMPKLTVWLEKGDMLYLPAGWFHEVSSFGGTDTSEDNNIHVAVNYWFAPPTTASFEAPYRDAYWISDYARTKEALSDF